VIGEKENRERSPAENPPLQNAIVRDFKGFRKQLIINGIFWEATGVELFSVLTTRKLLSPETATTAKRAPLPNLLYVYCTTAQGMEPVSGAAA
jgi:hypothetical protein